MTDFTSQKASGAIDVPSDADRFTAGYPDRSLPPLNWKWMMAAGVIYLLGGVAALLNPFVASLVAQSLIAAAFLISGLILIWIAFRNEDGTTGGRVLGAVSGLLAVVFAFMLWANPLEGMVSLTMTLAAFLIAIGAARIWVGFRMRDRKGSGWIIASGVLSLGLGAYIFATLPTAVFSVLGVFLAAELLFAGIAYVAMALSARPA